MNTKNHLTGIDGLKGIGAFIIAFIWHYQHFGPLDTNPLGNVFKLSYYWGWWMVDFFFILSGFGMMLGYGKRIIDREISFKDYFVKRFKKLYPLFFVTTIVILILQIIYKQKAGTYFINEYMDVYHVIQNLLCLQGGLLGTEISLNGPAWCISIFLLCYILFYFVMYRVKGKRHALYVFCFAAILGAALVGSGLSFPLLNDLVGRGVSCFSVGVILAYLYENREQFNSQKLGICCLVFLIVIFLILRFIEPSLSGDQVFLMTFGIGPMLVLCTAFIPLMNKVMGNPVLKWLGAISMDIYLWHFPIQCAIRTIDIYLGLYPDYTTKLVWLIYVIITIAVASLYHYLIAAKAESFIIGFLKKKNK